MILALDAAFRRSTILSESADAFSPLQFQAESERNVNLARWMVYRLYFIWFNIA